MVFSDSLILQNEASFFQTGVGFLHAIWVRNGHGPQKQEGLSVFIA